MGGSCSQICDPEVTCFPCIKNNSLASEDQEEILQEEYRNQSVQDNPVNQNPRESSRTEEMGTAQSTISDDPSLSLGTPGASQSRSSHRQRGQDLSPIASDDIVAGIMMRFAAERQRQSNPVTIDRVRAQRPGPSSVSFVFSLVNFTPSIFRVHM